MTQVRRPPKTRWWRFLLAAIAAVLVGLLGATTASAATLPELETRVGASPPAAQVLVGPHECITAGQHWGKAPPQADSVVASCVAAKSGSSLDEFWQLSNVGKSRAGTTVPESFDITTAGQKFSVHPNATKHMAEYARSSGTAPPISSLAGSIETAVGNGLNPGRNFVQVGQWELGIDTNGNVIYHALYRP